MSRNQRFSVCVLALGPTAGCPKTGFKQSWLDTLRSILPYYGRRKKFTKRTKLKRSLQSVAREAAKSLSLKMRVTICSTALHYWREESICTFAKRQCHEDMHTLLYHTDNSSSSGGVTVDYGWCIQAFQIKVLEPLRIPPELMGYKYLTPKLIEYKNVLHTWALITVE